jgi:drug/metabolite transporter (DMT)-like permease
VRTLLLMAVGVVAVSLSGPLMAAMVVPPLAISFWRNGLATAALAPGVAGGRRAEVAGVRGRTLGLVLGSGAALAVHFGTWVTALTLTSVASATAIVCLQVAWVVAWQLLRGERFNAGVASGLVTAFAGVLVVSGVDLSVSTRALVGDLLALVGGAAAAAYMLIGSRARQALSTTTYTFVCYGTCALVLLVACVVSGQRLWGYPLTQWGLLVLVTATAQLMGHSMFNHLLATTAPVLVSLVLLLEVPGAALLAAVILGQVPPLGAVVGLLVILAGTALVVLNNGAPGIEQAPLD